MKYSNAGRSASPQRPREDDGETLILGEFSTRKHPDGVMAAHEVMGHAGH